MYIGDVQGAGGVVSSGGAPTGRPEAPPFQARLHLLAALITARRANPGMSGLARLFLCTIPALQQRSIYRKLLGV